MWSGDCDYSCGREETHSQANKGGRITGDYFFFSHFSLYPAKVLMLLTLNLFKTIVKYLTVLGPCRRELGLFWATANGNYGRSLVLFPRSRAHRCLPSGDTVPLAVNSVPFPHFP